MHDWMRSLDKTFFTINLVSMNSPKSDAFEKASFLQQIPSKPFNFMSHQMNEDKNDERSVVDSVLVQEDSSTMRPPLHESSSMENTLAKSMLQDIENPTIERLRDGLRIRLQQSNQQAKQALLDQEKSLRALQKEREDVGVELYELQKQLSIMQSDRNELHEKRKDVTENRKQNDVSIHEIRKKLSDSQEALRTCKKRRVDLEAEVDEILKSHRLANTWNQDLKHDVAVSRRSALKTEDIVRDMEKNKKSQDLFLDQLNQQINALDSTITLLVEEKEAQCQQTNETKELILTTKHELDKLITEKKQFVQQWKAAIVSRNRREKALSECMRAFQEKQDTLTEAIREIALLRVDLISVNDEAHALVLDKNRQETEASYVQEETEKLRGNVETVATEFEIVRKSIAMSQERQLEVELQKNKMDAELASTRRKMQLVIKEKQKLEIRWVSFQNFIQRNNRQTHSNVGLWIVFSVKRTIKVY
jgi:chromosome segregation ATPase